MNLEKQIAEMREYMVRNESAMKRIESAIAGDEKFGTKGIIHKQEEQDGKIIELEEYKKKDEKLKNKMAGGILVGMPVLAAAIEWFKIKILGL